MLPVGSPAGDTQTLVVALRDGTVRAFALGDGRPLWQAPLDTNQSPTLADGVVYLLGRDGLTALASASGSLSWQVPLDAAPRVRPAVRSGWVVVPLDDGTLVALDARDGRTIWRRTDLTPASAPPTLASDRVYLPVVDGRILSLDLAEGRTLWERHLAGQPTEILALGDRLYVGSSGDAFYCLAARDGALLWRWRTGADVLGPPTFADRRVFFVALDNMLRAVDWRSGVQRWARPLVGRPAAPPWLSGDVVVVPLLGAELPLFFQRDGQSAGTLATRADLVVPPLLVETRPDPSLVLVTGEEAGPARLRVWRRASDPTLVPLSFLPGEPPLEPRLTPLEWWPGRPLPALTPPAPTTRSQSAGSPRPRASGPGLLGRPER